MQEMSGASGDTHDHGPPSNSGAAAQSTTLHKLTPFRGLVVWTTGLSDSSINAFSGATAGFMSGLVTCPLDVIKTKLQAQGSFSNHFHTGPNPPAAMLYKGFLGTAKTVLRQDGLVGFYRGLGPMLLGYLPTWAVYMTVYDRTRQHFKDRGYDQDTSGKWLSKIYASLVAGGSSTLATNPIWVIKTRLMSQISRTATDGARTPWNYTSTIDAARQMYRAEGIIAFYSGLTPALLGLTHVAIQFPLYEYLKQQFTGLELGESPAESGHEGQNTAGILVATFLSKVCATSATYPHEVLRTRLQTQQRHVTPESNTNGVATSHHSQSLPTPKKRIGNTDGTAYRPRYRGVVHGCRVILRDEGWRAFYAGMGTNMIRAVPAAMTTMLTYESVKGMIGRLQKDGREIVKDRES